MTKPTRRATKTDTIIQNARGEQQIRGLNRHRIIPRVIQPPQGGANTPPSGQGFGTTGNFLEPQGDTMVGPIAFFPKEALIDATDPNNPSIDIGRESSSFTTYILTGSTNDKLGTILNAAFAGQLLYLEAIAPTLELINGDATNSGNILTGTGASLFVGFGNIATLIFDQFSTTGDPNIQGAWRVVSGGETGTAGGNAKTGFMITSTGSTQVVASGPAVILDVFDITVIQDGVTVNTTTNTITIQETGRYLFGLNLTLSADVNNTTADFALVVNGVPLTNVNSVFLRGFGDNDGLYPAAPSDFNAGDTLEISISHDKGVPVTFTFQECGFYLVKQESGGGGGEGGATSLGELSDVTLTGPVLDQVLTFDGAFWINKAFPSGGLATDLSNMSDPTIPTVPLSMNTQNIQGVNILDFENAGARTISSLSNLNFFQTGQEIVSQSGTLLYQVDGGQSHKFDVGGVSGIQVADIGGGVLALELFNNSIDKVKDISFTGNAIIPNTSTGIGLNTAGATDFLEYNVESTGLSHQFRLEGNTRLIVSLNGIEVNGTTTSDILQLEAGGSVSVIPGRMRSDGTDVFIFSGGEERNITNVVAGDFNSISQGNSSVTVLDSGVGSITNIIDGFLVSTQDSNNFAIQQSVSFGNNSLSGLGITTPASIASTLGDATRFWGQVFTDEVLFQNTLNRILGDSGGINYEVDSSIDNHFFSVGGLGRVTVSSSGLNLINGALFNMGGAAITNTNQITMNNASSLLEMRGGDITLVGELTMQGTTAFIDMNGGDINDVDDLTFRGTSSSINMNGGDILNADFLSATGNVILGSSIRFIDIAGDLRHSGSEVGFFGQDTVVRQVVRNPLSTSNNDLFVAINNLINALGTLTGFGMGLVDTQN